MGFMGPKRFTLPFILILASLISVSSAGGQQRFFDKYPIHLESRGKEPAKKVVRHEEAFVVHSRVLQVQTNDYGKYDPSPSVDKPPHKFIPN